MSDERDNDKKDKTKDLDRVKQLDRAKADGQKPNLDAYALDHGFPDPKVGNMEQRLHEDARIVCTNDSLDRGRWSAHHSENEMSLMDKMNTLSTVEKQLADSQGREEMGIRLSDDKTGRHLNEHGEERCYLREKDFTSLETSLPTYLGASRESYQQAVINDPNKHSEVDADTLRSWQDSHKVQGGPTPSGDSLNQDAKKYQEEMVAAYVNSQDVRDEKRKNR